LQIGGAFFAVPIEEQNMDRHELSDDGIRHPVFTVAVCIFILVFGFLFSCLGAAEEPSDSSQRQMTAAAVSGRRQRPCSETDDSDRAQSQITATEAGSESASPPPTLSLSRIAAAVAGPVTCRCP